MNRAYVETCASFQLQEIFPSRPLKYLLQPQPGLLYGGDCLVRGLVFVATSHITNEELFLKYAHTFVAACS